jgi:UDP-3-O-[3-hydroxymyristoyl] glucosamine N-acyltransferase
MISIFGPFKSYALTEDDRVLKAIHPQTLELRECYIKSSALYASKTCEAAAVIVDAVLGKCAPEETNLSQAIHIAAPYANRAFVESFMEGTRNGARRFMLKAILDKRVELGNCRPTSPNVARP